MVGLYNVVQLLPNLLDVLTVDYYLTPLKQSAASLAKFCELVEVSIVLDVAQYEDNRIKPEFNPKLVELENQMSSLIDAINQIHLNVGDDLNIDVNKKLKLENHQTYGWCLRLTRAESVVIRNKRQYEQLQTQKWEFSSLPPN